VEVEGGKKPSTSSSNTVNFLNNYTQSY